MVTDTTSAAGQWAEFSDDQLRRLRRRQGRTLASRRLVSPTPTPWDGFQSGPFPGAFRQARFDFSRLTVTGWANRADGQIKFSCQRTQSRSFDRIRDIRSLRGLPSSVWKAPPALAVIPRHGCRGTSRTLVGERSVICGQTATRRCRKSAPQERTTRPHHNSGRRVWPPLCGLPPNQRHRHAGTPLNIFLTANRYL